jgi:prephenate dehydratase
VASKSDNIIAFQGLPSAYSDLACRAAQPKMTTLPCPSFEDAFAAVKNGDARLAMIPIENSLAGRVADIHHLLPEAGLHIIGEHFQRVNHHLLALPGARLEQIKTVHSHVHALNQCRRLLRELGLTPKVHADTAGAAAEVAETGRVDQAAIASRLAAEIYGLEILRADIEDAEHNTTRFIILAREAREPPPYEGPVITSFLFQVRNVPAALYKALGGFPPTAST